MYCYMYIYWRGIDAIVKERLWVVLHKYCIAFPQFWGYCVWHLHWKRPDKFRWVSCVTRLLFRYMPHPCLLSVFLILPFSLSTSHPCLYSFWLLSLFLIILFIPFLCVFTCTNCSCYLCHFWDQGSHGWTSTDLRGSSSLILHWGWGRDL